jgi:hypothetical protein
MNDGPDRPVEPPLGRQTGSRARVTRSRRDATTPIAGPWLLLSMEAVAKGTWVVTQSQSTRSGCGASGGNRGRRLEKAPCFGAFSSRPLQSRPSLVELRPPVVSPPQRCMSARGSHPGCRQSGAAWRQPACGGRSAVVGRRVRRSGSRRGLRGAGRGEPLAKARLGRLLRWRPSRLPGLAGVFLMVRSWWGRRARRSLAARIPVPVWHRCRGAVPRGRLW